MDIHIKGGDTRGIQEVRISSALLAVGIVDLAAYEFIHFYSYWTEIITCQVK